MTGSCGVSSTPRLHDSITDASEYWVARSSRAMTAETVARLFSTDTPSHPRGAKRQAMQKIFRPLEGVGNAGRGEARGLLVAALENKTPKLL
jgi:hypothetical protein